MIDLVQNWMVDIFSPVQLLAWIAAVIFIASFQKQSADKTIRYWIPADVFMVLHFFFLQAPFFIMIAGGSIVRSIIAIKCSYKILISYIAVYLLLLAASLLIFDFGLREYIAFIGTLFFSASILSKEKFFLHRGFLFGHQITWIIAFSLLGSYGGIALISFMLISNIIGTGRYFFNSKSV